MWVLAGVLSGTGCGIKLGWDDYGDDEAGGEPPHSHARYFISEVQSYAVGSCTDSTLNNVGKSLWTILEANGWDGQYVLDDTAKVSDFWESNIGGNDAERGDAYAFSVFAGHGNIGQLKYRWAEPGQSEARLRASSKPRRQ